MCKLGTRRIYCLAQVSEVSPVRTQYEFNPWLFVLNHRENLPLSDVKFIAQRQTHKPKPAEQFFGLQSSHLAWVEPCPRVITKGAQHSPLAMSGSQCLGKMLRYKSPVKTVSGKGKYYLFPEEGGGKVTDALAMSKSGEHSHSQILQFNFLLCSSVTFKHSLKLQVWRPDIPCYALQWVPGFISVTPAYHWSHRHSR